MIDLDSVILRRADEQVARARLDHRYERDPWAIAGPDPKATRVKAPPSTCKATNCGRPARSTGYCHRCGRRVARGIPVDWDPSEPGRRPDVRRTA